MLYVCVFSFSVRPLLTVANLKKNVD